MIHVLFCYFERGSRHAVHTLGFAELNYGLSRFFSGTLRLCRHPPVELFVNLVVHFTEIFVGGFSTLRESMEKLKKEKSEKKVNR